ncbi:MAG: hypothetical protein L0Y58_09685 [Verrucomicrobia subdivision 3 bacterium]|nr:hypothetical protein [Limisphaerales bacterium]
MNCSVLLAALAWCFLVPITSAADDSTPRRGSKEEGDGVFSRVTNQIQGIHLTSSAFRSDWHRTRSLVKLGAVAIEPLAQVGRDRARSTEHRVIAVEALGRAGRSEAKAALRSLLDQPELPQELHEAVGNNLFLLGDKASVNARIAEWKTYCDLPIAADSYERRMAALYYETGRFKEAARLYGQLLKKPAPVAEQETANVPGIQPSLLRCPGRESRHGYRRRSAFPQRCGE